MRGDAKLEGNHGGLWSTLTDAAARVPGGRWIFAPIGLGAAGSMVLGAFFGSPSLALFGTSLAFAFMVLFYAFARGTRDIRSLAGPLVFLIWSVTGLFILLLLTAYSCVFFEWPLRIQALASVSSGTAEPRPPPSVSASDQSDATAGRIRAQEMLERTPTTYPKELLEAFDLASVEGEIARETLVEKLCLDRRPDSCSSNAEICKQKTDACRITKVTLHRYLNVLERMALGVNSGIYDNGLVRESKKKVATKVYRAFRNYMRMRREEQKNPNIWNQFEIMVRGWDPGLPAVNAV